MKVSSYNLSCIIPDIIKCDTTNSFVVVCLTPPLTIFHFIVLSFYCSVILLFCHYIVLSFYCSVILLVEKNKSKPQNYHKSLTKVMTWYCIKYTYLLVPGTLTYVYVWESNSQL